MTIIHCTYDQTERRVHVHDMPPPYRSGLCQLNALTQYADLVNYTPSLKAECTGHGHEPMVLSLNTNLNDWPTSRQVCKHVVSY